MSPHDRTLFPLCLLVITLSTVSRWAVGFIGSHRCWVRLFLATLTGDCCGLWSAGVSACGSVWCVVSGWSALTNQRLASACWPRAGQHWSTRPTADRKSPMLDENLQCPLSSPSPSAARRAAMALSKLSGDEAGIVFIQLCNVLDPRVAVDFSTASLELREPTSFPTFYHRAFCWRPRADERHDGFGFPTARVHQSQ
eukprot:scaffold44908_cov66-Phaeocystis_antarctica.AAC.1